MNKKICNIAVISALSLITLEAKANTWNIGDGDPTIASLNSYPGYTDLNFNPTSTMNYRFDNVYDLNSVTFNDPSGLPFLQARLIGNGTADTTIDTVIVNDSAYNNYLKDMTINNAIINGGSITVGYTMAGQIAGGHVENALVNKGYFYLSNTNLASATLKNDPSEYVVTAGTIDVRSNGSDFAMAGIDNAYVDTLNIDGTGALSTQNAWAAIDSGSFINRITVKNAEIDKVQSENQINFLQMESANASFYDNSHINSVQFIDANSVLAIGSYRTVDELNNGKSASSVLTTLGGVDNNEAVVFNIAGGNQFSKLVIIDGDATYGGGPVLDTAPTLNSDGELVQNAGLIKATNATQTAIVLNGDNINFDVTSLDDTYMNVTDWENGHFNPGYRYDPTYFGGGVNSGTLGRHQNLLDVTADATLLKLNGNYADLTLNTSGEGWDTGGIRINGDHNSIRISNNAYNGFINAQGASNRIHLDDFDHLSSVVTAGAGTNYVYIDTFGSARDVVIGTENLGFTSNIVDTISGNMDLYLTSWDDVLRVNLHDAQAKGDATLDIDTLTLSNATLNLNRTNPLTLGTLSNKDTFTLAGTLRTDGVSFMGNSIVNMGAGRNTELRINGSLLAVSNDPLTITNYTLSLDENQGDHISVGDQIVGPIVIDLGTITDLGHGNDSIEIINAPSDVRGDESIALSGTNVSYNGLTGFYTLGASPYAWDFSYQLGGYYLSNVFDGGTPVFTPSVNASVSAPIAATHFLGANISQSINNYMQATPLGVSHSQDMWGQYVYQKQQQDVIGGLSYAAKMTGWDIGMDIANEKDYRWGLAASYRGLTNDLRLDVADVSDASTGMDAVLLSAYGTRAQDAHVIDGQIYVGQAWATHNIVGEGRQEKNKGILWGGYGQYGHKLALTNDLTVTPTVGLNYHETQWSDKSFSDGHNRYTRMYLELPLSGQNDDGLMWSIAPRYSYNFNAESDVRINGVINPVKTADMRHEYGLSATLTQKTERNGSWYIKLSNDQLKDGDRTNLTIGGSGVF